jgi:hypothetical protein
MHAVLIIIVLIIYTSIAAYTIARTYAPLHLPRQQLLICMQKPLPQPKSVHACSWAAETASLAKNADEREARGTANLKVRMLEINDLHKKGRSGKQAC